MLLLSLASANDKYNDPNSIASGRHQMYQTLSGLSEPEWIDHTNFVIDAEEGHAVWADYHRPDFGSMGVSQKIVDVLDKYGLHTQWIDAGTLGVYE